MGEYGLNLPGTGLMMMNGKNLVKFTILETKDNINSRNREKQVIKDIKLCINWR